MGNLGFFESLTTEFKSDKTGLSDSDILDVISGFSNTDGGSLYIGVEDNGDITGLTPRHKDTDKLCAMIASKTVPSVTVTASLIQEGDIAYVRVDVPKSSWSIISTSSGKTLKRRLKHDGTPETVALYPHEFASRLSELHRIDYSAQLVPNAVYEDLDDSERNKLRYVIENNRTRSDLALLELSDEELDLALQLVKRDGEKLVPTVTGLLLIGKEERIQQLLPTSEISFQVLDGTENVRVNDSFIKPLLSSIEVFDEYMKYWNPEREVRSGLFRISVSEFDPLAFREALINALCHRDYTILKRVRILIDDDGLSISSPGGFIEGITLENLLTVEPHGRNPALADAFKRIGLAERTGRGIDRIYEGSLIYGKPLPDYSESNSTQVKLFIQRALPDEAFTQMVFDEKNRLGRNLPINSLLVLFALKEERRADIHQISAVTHLTMNKAKTALEKLSEAGLVEKRGTGRGRTYMLSSNVYRKTASMIEYVRQRDIEVLRQNPLVLQLAESKVFITRKDVVALLHLSESQAYRVLKKLVDDDKLILVGRGRSAKYKLKASSKS